MIDIMVECNYAIIFHTGRFWIDSDMLSLFFIWGFEIGFDQNTGNTVIVLPGTIVMHTSLLILGHPEFSNSIIKDS